MTLGAVITLHGTPAPAGAKKTATASAGCGAFVVGQPEVAMLGKQVANVHDLFARVLKCG
ncbi:hypothetical protein AB0J43_22080 [Nonomuraea fuscirosea]